MPDASNAPMGAEQFPNPAVAGNGGTIIADGGPMHGFTSSARIVIPADALLVLAVYLR